jgi:peptidoglycan/xylan/chitin deacetylase (PgdA/CDA1 family)
MGIWHSLHDGGNHVIVHRDVPGKALALMLLFALAVTAFFFAQRVPPREVVARRNVVDAMDTRAAAAGARQAEGEGPVEVRGLDYQVPHAKGAGAGLRTTLDRMRDSGLLRGYSVPPRMLAFKLDGSAVLVPPAQAVAGPRDPVVIFHGTRDKKRIALTFDTSEVSEPTTAKAVMDQLTRLRAPATFFVCGAWCYKNPELLRIAVARGFEVANHSFGHPQFTLIPDEQVTSELKSTAEAVEKVSGAKISAYFRPPYGDTDDRVEQLAAQLGYATVLWDKDTFDWGPDTTQPEIRDRATVGARAGDIVLMHTLGRHTPETLIEIVNNLRADGFELTTLTGVMQP